jgi:hypothetical protein
MSALSRRSAVRTLAGLSLATLTSCPDRVYPSQFTDARRRAAAHDRDMRSEQQRPSFILSSDVVDPPRTQLADNGLVRAARRHRRKRTAVHEDYGLVNADYSTKSVYAAAKNAIATLQ